jgi:hypothetical protein
MAEHLIQDSPMKPPIRKPGQTSVKGQGTGPSTFAPPTPKVARRKPAKVLSAAERAAFLASRPDLKPSK